MKLHISSFVDLSVGIYPIGIAIDLGIDIEREHEDMREYIRKTIKDLYGELWDVGNLYVRFEDECPECCHYLEKKGKVDRVIKIQENTYKRCDFKFCLSNIEEENDKNEKI
jgi:hypothetical protein